MKRRLLFGAAAFNLILGIAIHGWASLTPVTSGNIATNIGGAHGIIGHAYIGQAVTTLPTAVPTSTATFTATPTFTPTKTPTPAPT